VPGSATDEVDGRGLDEDAGPPPEGPSCGAGDAGREQSDAGTFGAREACRGARTQAEGKGAVMTDKDRFEQNGKKTGKGSATGYNRPRTQQERVYPIFVRVERGQAKVVGYLWTRPEKE